MFSSFFNLIIFIVDSSVDYEWLVCKMLGKWLNILSLFILSHVKDPEFTVRAEETRQHPGLRGFYNDSEVVLILLLGVSLTGPCSSAMLDAARYLMV